MKAIMKPIDAALKWCLVFLAATMIIVVTWQVVSRYVLRAPSSLTEEIARFQLIWLGLLGAVYTFRNRMHVGIDILVTPLTGKPRLITELIALISCLIFALVILLYGGARLVSLTYELDQNSAALGIRMAYIYSVIPISGVLMSLYALQYIGDIIFRGEIHKPSEVSPDEQPSLSPKDI
jgi:TRAP-type C4-dicarboxylate transport system permease small subunit